VAEGQAVVILESMKMEIAVSAPAAGVVAAIRCREGMVVAVGQLLVEVGPPDDR
jgi:urea carboxylase